MGSKGMGSKGTASPRVAANGTGPDEAAIDIQPAHALNGGAIDTAANHRIHGATYQDELQIRAP
jgi:hypothetical protein